MAMDTQQDARDWFILGAVTAIVTAATVYLFMFHSDATFGIWSGVVTTIVGLYHVMIYLDDKKPDA
jgi:hypothetical protein